MNSKSGTSWSLRDPLSGERTTNVQLDVARSFLSRLTDTRGKAFAARWHGLIAVLYCIRDDATRARREIREGLSLDFAHFAAMSDCSRNFWTAVIATYAIAGVWSIALAKS